jgi:Phage endonuclease I
MKYRQEALRKRTQTKTKKRAYRRHSPGKGRFRSLFEKHVADWMYDRKIIYGYETIRLPYFLRERNKVVCPNCGPVFGHSCHIYKPDFDIPKSGAVIECKGKLTSVDRTKLLAIRKEYPELNLYLLFQRNNPVKKGGTKRYLDWAMEAGIPAAVFKGSNDDDSIPSEWYNYAKRETGISKDGEVPKVPE